MFIGHFGAGLAGKKAGKKISLGTLFMAAQWLDLIWPIFVLLNIGIVKINPGDTKTTPLNFVSYPFSHSLLFVLIWAVLFGGVYYLVKRNLKYSMLLGLLVVSHWILDLFVHRPDLPLYPGGALQGFGLWNYPLIEIPLEIIIFIIGIYLYVSSTKAKDKTGTFAFWGLIVFLTVIFIMNLVGPPPPDTNAIGFAGLGMWLIVIWGYWADKHRESNIKS
ncbi:MAG: metal-dependent hydrolase [Ignavibacteria bacterium]|jgi:hypothetical protein